MFNVKKKWALRVLLALPVVALVVGLGLPGFLGLLGLHPSYEIPAFDLKGKKALVIATNHDTLGDTGQATGAFGSEFSVPYYAFLDAGLQVDIASPRADVSPWSQGRWTGPSRQKRTGASRRIPRR